MRMYHMQIMMHDCTEHCVCDIRQSCSSAKRKKWQNGLTLQNTTGLMKLRLIYLRRTWSSVCACRAYQHENAIPKVRQGASRLRALLPLGVEVWFNSYCQRRFDQLSNPEVCVIFPTSTICVMLAQAHCFCLQSWLKLKMRSQLQPIRSFQEVIHVMIGWCRFFLSLMYIHQYLK